MGRQAREITRPRVALYARVSTRQHGQDVETQLQALRAWARQRKYRVVEYADRGISGAKRSRPELDRMLRDCRRGEIDLVAVWRFNRFARSVRQLIGALEEFRELGVGFVSLSEAIDTSTPAGKMLFTVIAAIGEFERDVIRENVQLGVDRARRRGKTLGRPRNAKVDEEEIVRQVGDGETIAAVARQHHIARSTVRAIVGRTKPKAGKRRKEEKARRPKGKEGRPRRDAEGTKVRRRPNRREK